MSFFALGEAHFLIHGMISTIKTLRLDSSYNSSALWKYVNFARKVWQPMRRQQVGKYRHGIILNADGYEDASRRKKS